MDTFMTSEPVFDYTAVAKIVDNARKVVHPNSVRMNLKVEKNADEHNAVWTSLANIHQLVDGISNIQTTISVFTVS